MRELVNWSERPGAICYNVATGLAVVVATAATIRYARLAGESGQRGPITAVRFIAIMAGPCQSATSSLMRSERLAFYGEFSARSFVAPFALFCAAWVFTSIRGVTFGLRSVFALQLCCCGALGLAGTWNGVFDDGLPWLPPYSGAWFASFAAFYFTNSARRGAIIARFFVRRQRFSAISGVFSAIGSALVCSAVVAVSLFDAALGQPRCRASASYAQMAVWLFPCAWLAFVATAPFRACAWPEGFAAAFRGVVVAVACLTLTVGIMQPALRSARFFNDATYVLLVLCLLQFARFPRLEIGDGTPH